MKRQNYQRKNFIWKKVLFSIMLTAVLLVNIWAAFPVNSEAAGSIDWSNEDVWGEGIELKGYHAELNVTANKVKIGDNDLELQNISTDEKVPLYQISTRYDENATMSIPELNPNVTYKNGTFSFNGKEYTETSFHVSLKTNSTVTYYKVVTDTSETYAFSDFEEKVREAFKKANTNSKVSDHMLVTDKEGSPAGYAFQSYIKSYMQEKGAGSYTSEKTISLKNACRIDMITISFIDHYLYQTIDNQRISRDYDEAVYTCYSYQTPVRLNAPVPEMESKTRVSDSAATTVFKDDSITGWTIESPIFYNQAMSDAYTKIKEKFKYEYYFSDSRLTSFNNVVWKEWKEEVALEGKKYLYVKAIIPEEADQEDTSIYKFLDSEIACYEWKYQTDQPEKITGTVKSVALREDKASSSKQKDLLTLSSSDGAGIYYTTDGTTPIGEKATLTTTQKQELEQLGAKEAVGTILTYENNKYVKINQFWYLCSNTAQKFDSSSSIQLEYDENRNKTVTVQAAVDGKVIGEVQEITYQKLLPPTIYLEDGSELKNDPISSEDKIVLKADGQNSGKWQYHLDDKSISEISEESWEDWTGAFSPENHQYLYVRTVVDDSGATDVTSYIRVKTISYVTEKTDKVSAKVETNPTVGGTSLTDTVTFENIRNNALVFYSTQEVNQPFTAGVQDTIITELNKLAEEKTFVSVTYDGKRYVKLNRVWYQCDDAVNLYENGVSLKHDELNGNGVTVYAWQLEEGKTINADAAVFSYEKMSSPEPTLESKRTLDQEVDEADQLVTLKISDKLNTADVTCQYYLSDKKLTTVDQWMTWQGSPVPLNGKKYLYVRVIPKDQSGTTGYTGSAPTEYEIQYIEGTPGTVTAAAYADDDTEIKDGVDYGDKIELIKLATEEKNAMIFYTVNKGEPVFTKVSYEYSQVLEESNQGSDMISILKDGKRYVKLNGLWYECGEDTKLYEDKITVDESIYTSNYMVINAQALVDGKVIGAANRFTYAFSLRTQTETPTANPKDGENISMGDSVSLYCSTDGSRIFYTVNGSAPVVSLNGTEVVLGKETHEFKDSPIEITDDIADYGSSFTITAIACKLATQDGQLVRTMKDSELARFVYKVTDQPVVEKVTSVPATDSDKQTVVEIGTKIRLYSATDGVTIFYTTDGSEPVFDETTLEPENTATKKYNGSEGITVPEIGDSSLFTITAVAYKEGLASSAISRLIFSYPSAVSSPYATPSDGSVTENTQVTLKTSTEGAVIYYEIAHGNDTPKDPTEESNVFDSANPFIITKKTTIKAYAVKDGMESQIVTFTYEVSEKLSTPTPSIASGGVVASGTVIGLDADKDATIYYTVDGSDPKKADNKKVLVGDRVIISGKAGDVISIRTYAAKTGYSDSEVGYYSYSISSYDGGIFADKETGSTVKNGEIIHLSSDVSGAVIHYTTDGSTPGESSASGSAVTITGDPGENVIVKAIAIADGTDKAVSAATFTYTIMDRLAAPSASVPDGAVFTEEGAVELSAETGKIYYTTDGSDPTTASNLYKKAIEVTEAVTIKAIAAADDYEQSEISTFTYGFADQVAAPTANFASGELEMGTEVTFSTTTEGATIYYRTDGMEPSLDDKSKLTLYTGPITVEKAVTFKVIAVKNHMADSKILTAGYTVREPVAAEETEEEELIQDTAGTGRLQSRRNFSNAQSGPSFTDVVLKNAVYGVVISSDESVLPENTQLLVEQTAVTDASERMVKQIISETYSLVAAYNVTLLSDGQEVQPDGEIEIGLPIPAAYENSIVQVVCLQEDGSVETFETRRSGGEAYIKTSHLSVYAIAAPTEYSEGKKAFPWLPVIYSAAVLLTAAGILLLYRSRKKREDESAE